ncbi:MAG: hypothetical protein ACYC4A_01575 [Desulfobulbia bacterium]
MKLFKSIAAVAAFLLLTGAAWAATDAEIKEAKAAEAAFTQMAKDLRALYRAGVAIPKKYNTSNMNELRTCVAEYQPHRDRAAAIRKRAMAISPWASPRLDKISLVQAADLAFICVYCSGTGADCAKIPPLLDMVEKKLALKD